MASGPGRARAAVFVAVATLAAPRPADAQSPEGRLPLQPVPPGGHERVIPFMDGWYENEDGSFSISFGYLNQKRDVVIIPHGDHNVLELDEFDGAQPTVFLPGRHRGVFAVTVPSDRRTADVWWQITNATGEVTRVPGRATVEAYELDWIPRPHGSLPPSVWFEEGGETGRGPPGVTAPETLTARVGTPLTVVAHTRDPSPRDPDDHRFREPVELRAVWSVYQGPAEVTFSRHESNPLPELDETTRARLTRAAAGTGAAAAAARARLSPPPEVIRLTEGHGPAGVMVTFAEPGEYVLRVQVDNFAGPDSAGVDQCCWTNGYVRVRVEG